MGSCLSQRSLCVLVVATIALAAGYDARLPRTSTVVAQDAAPQLFLPSAFSGADLSLHPVAQVGGFASHVAAANGLVYANIGPRVVAFSTGEEGDLVPVAQSPVLAMRWIVDVAATTNVVAAVSDSLLLLDTDTSPHLTLRGQLGDVGGVHTLQIADGAAFLCRQSDLIVVDISDVEHPLRIATMPMTLSESCALSPDGKLLAVLRRPYTSDYPYVPSYVVELFDVSSPSNVRLLGPVRSGMPYISAVVFADTHLVIMESTSSSARNAPSALRVVDISDPEDSSLRASMGLPSGDLTKGQLRYLDGVVFASNGYFVYVCDVLSDVPSVLAEVPLLSSDLAVGEGVLYAADGNVVEFDVTEPAAIHRSGTYETSGRWRGIARLGSNMVLVDEDRLWVFDGSTDAPESIARVDLSSDGGLRDVAASGDLAVALGGWGIVTVDASMPTSPRVVGRSTIVGTPYRVVADDRRDLAYVSSLGFGGRLHLGVIDIADPAAPSNVGDEEVPLPSSAITRATGLAYADGKVFVAIDMRGTEHTGALMAFDVSDPAAPTLVGQYNLVVGHATDVAISGTTAYVGVWSGGSGLVVLDVSDPRRITLVGEHPTRAHRLALAPSTVFASGYGVALAFDVSRPESPRIAASAHHDGTTGIPALLGDQVWLATNTSGLFVYRSNARHR